MKLRILAKIKVVMKKIILSRPVRSFLLALIALCILAYDFECFSGCDSIAVIVYEFIVYFLGCIFLSCAITNFWINNDEVNKIISERRIISKKIMDGMKNFFSSRPVRLFLLTLIALYILTYNLECFSGYDCFCIIVYEFIVYLLASFVLPFTAVNFGSNNGKVKKIISECGLILKKIMDGVINFFLSRPVRSFLLTLIALYILAYDFECFSRCDSIAVIVYEFIVYLLGCIFLSCAIVDFGSNNDELNKIISERRIILKKIMDSVRNFFLSRPFRVFLLTLIALYILAYDFECFSGYDCDGIIAYEFIVYFLASFVLPFAIVKFWGNHDKVKQIIIKRRLAYRILVYLLPLVMFIVVFLCVGLLLSFLTKEFNVNGYIGAAATFSAAIVALFKDRYDRYCYKPKLNLEFDINDERSFSVERMEDNSKGYMLRIKISNDGLGWAENVMLRIETVNGSKFPPMFLTWTNNFDKRNEERIRLKKMYLGIDYFCDLAEIRGTNNHDVILATEVKPFNKSTRFACSAVTKVQKPQHFRLTLIADNFMPKSYDMSLDYNRWFPVNQKDQMKSNGIFVSIEEQKKTT